LQDLSDTVRRKAAGNVPPNVAPLVVNAGVSYRFDHWRWPLEIGGSMRYVGNRFLEQDNLTTLDAYTTADIYAFLDIPGRDVASRNSKTCAFQCACAI